MPVRTNSAKGKRPVCRVWSRTKRSRNLSSVCRVRRSTLNDDGWAAARPAGVRKISPVMSLVVPTASDDTGNAASFSRTTYFADEPASIVKCRAPDEDAGPAAGPLEGVDVVEAEGVRV